MGFSILPRGLSVCEHTVNKPPEVTEDGVETSRTVNIINDLATDSTFCKRPFVTSGPKLRFYAGVPITTPNNIRIGSYCVLDDKPRDGLSSLEIDFLHQMSLTVMSHLEGLRMRAELGIGTNMLTGLGHLVSTSTAGLTGRERIPQRLLQDTEPPTPANDVRPDIRRSSINEGDLEAAVPDGAIDTSSKRSTRHPTGASPPAGKIILCNSQERGMIVAFSNPALCTTLRSTTWKSLQCSWWLGGCDNRPSLCNELHHIM